MRVAAQGANLPDETLRILSESVTSISKNWIQSPYKKSILAGQFVSDRWTAPYASDFDVNGTANGEAVLA
jgi:hypothetical protein